MTAPGATSERIDETPTRRTGDPYVGRRASWLAILTRTLVCVGVLVGAVAIFALLFLTRPTPPKHENDGPTLLVRTITADRVDVPRIWDGFGTARAMVSADVPAQVAGRVVERPDRIEEGASVASGELLVRIDPTDYEQRVLASQKRAEAVEADMSALEVEEANLRQQVKLAEEEERTAQRDYDRAIDVDKAGAGSPGEIDLRLATLRRTQRSLEALRQQLEVIPARRARLEAQLASESATLRIERENLARTSVTSPIDGVLQLVNVEEGEWISISQTVARVVDLRRIEIPLRLAMSAQDSVSVGDRVELRPDGPTDAVWSGRVARIAPEGDRSTRTLGVYVEVTQDPGGSSALGSGTPLLSPGRFVVGRVVTSRVRSRVLVPRRAINGDRVLLAQDDGKAGSRRVRAVDVRVEHYYTGLLAGQASSEREWAVLEPSASIDPGSSVILSNLDQLVDGMVVGVRTTDVAHDGGAPEPTRESTAEGG
ncbi:MAG: HlyD family efflux transporter periplasmic adaptor subunit [Phycisphaerales bacterium]